MQQQERIPRVDVMLASYESVVQDISALQAIRWDALVLDLRSGLVCCFSPSHCH